MALIDGDDDPEGRRDLAALIPGVGERTSAVVLSFPHDVDQRYSSGAAVCCFAGLPPPSLSSGSSLSAKAPNVQNGPYPAAPCAHMPRSDNVVHRTDLG